MMEGPQMIGGSRRQARIVEVLWAQYCQDRWVLVSGQELRLRTGIARPGADIPMARIKLRRQGWDLESHNGRNGGYRLVRWNG
jgi:hypothetical protein